MLLSSILGFFIGKYLDTPGIQDEESSIRNGKSFIYTNPLLECENNGTFAKQKYIPFESEVIQKIEKNIKESHSWVLLSVYFRNLNNGPWFGIKENEKYIPASLMKITLLISYMKWYEEDPTLLDKKIPVNENTSMTQMIAPQKQLQRGSEYSIRELLYYLIVYSDNNASKTLFEYIPIEKQSKTFSELWVPVPDMTNINYSLSVKEYASFFRILYNGSYLAPKTSEEALSILASSTYENGLRGWVRKDISIAHKFWEREYMYENWTTLNQLHDCGIVYHPNYPYLVCIMTRGNTPLETLGSAIRDTSKIIFDEIDSRYPNKK